MRLNAIFFFAALLALGCSKKDSAKEKEEPEVTDEQPEENGETEAAPAPAEEKKELEKKKLGEMTPFDYMDILEAKGWTDASSGGMAMGEWESKTIKAKRDGLEAEVTLVQPSGGEADPNATMTARAPKDLLAEYREKGAAELLKEDVLLAVVIEGQPEEAKALLAHIREWVIVE